MNITINGEPMLFENDEKSIIALLEALSVDIGRGLAVAINEQVIPKADYLKSIIKDGDRVEIVQAVAGG